MADSPARSHVHAHGHDDHAHDAEHHHAHEPAREHHDHGHDHAHDYSRAPEAKLAAALVLTIVYCLVEAGAGLYFRSLALLADAGHMVSDGAALFLALLAQRVARRSRTRARTFGHRRAEVLAAFVNGIALGATAIGVLFEAVRRWWTPPSTNGTGVLVTASIGLVVNVGVALVLTRGAHNENTRAALAHVIADALGSVGAIAAALAMIFFGWRRADPAISGLIALLLAYGSWKLVVRTTRVLMEGAPAAINLGALERVVESAPGVAAIHDLHAWTISEGFDAVSVHVVLREGFHGTDVASDVSRRVHDAFGVEHVTVQPERSPAPLLPPDSLVRRSAP